MPRFERELTDAVHAALTAEEKFAKRKQKITDEIIGERTRERRQSLPVEISTLVDARLGKDPIAKEQVAANQWQIQRAIMFGQLELIEQNRTIIEMLGKLVAK